MTDEQKKARKQSAESGNIRWIKDHCLRTKDDNDDYVFISYKSDSYEQALDDIVYKACRKYGLRVYFDTAFDDGSDSWITQFYDNMCSKKCKAMIAFLDNKYYSSYATLMEMMAHRTRKAGGDMKQNSLFFLPINIGDITDIQDERNTGLGTERFADGRINIQASEELRLFNRLFKELIETDIELKGKGLEYIYDKFDDKTLYQEKTKASPAYGKMYLNITGCHAIMKTICPKSNSNDGTNKDFVEVIHDKLVNAGIGSVFGPAADDAGKKSDVSKAEPVKTAGRTAGQTPVNNPDGDDAVKIVRGEIVLSKFLDEYDETVFKPQSYDSIELIGINECERYTLKCNADGGKFKKTAQLVKAFAVRQMNEMGMEYIELVNNHMREQGKKGQKHVIFMTPEEYREYCVGKTKAVITNYVVVSSDAVKECYMYLQYSPYDWLKTCFQSQLEALKLSADDFILNFG